MDLTHFPMDSQLCTLEVIFFKALKDSLGKYFFYDKFKKCEGLFLSAHHKHFFTYIFKIRLVISILVSILCLVR